MKGKKEGGEIKGREGRKRGKGEKERGKKKEKERERKKQQQSSTAGLEPATFHSATNAYGYRLEGRFARMYYTCIYRKF